MTGAELFRAWRERKGLTQREVAERLGTSQASVCDWENGKKIPKLPHILAIEALTGRAVKTRAWLRGGGTPSERTGTLG